MAFKPNKTQRRELAALQDAYVNAAEAYNEALMALIDDWQGEFDDRSDKWREGEVAQVVQEKLDRIQEAADACAYPIQVEFDDL